LALSRRPLPAANRLDRSKKRSRHLAREVCRVVRAAHAVVMRDCWGQHSPGFAQFTLSGPGTFLRSSDARATRQNPLAPPGKSRCLLTLPREDDTACGVALLQGSGFCSLAHNTSGVEVLSSHSFIDQIRGFGL